MRSIFTSLALLAWAPTALAVEPGPPAEATSTVRLGLALGALGGNYDVGTEAALTLDLRLQSIVLGVSGALAYGGGSAALVGLRLGTSLALTDSLDLDLLAEGGLRLAHSGGGIMDDDPGAELLEGYLGARVSLDYAVNDVAAPVTFRVGLSLFARASLSGSVWDTYEYEDCVLSGCRTETATHEVGGVHDFGATLNLSLDFGDW